MDNNKDVQNALLKTIDTMIDNKIKNLGFNYYVDAIINGINTNVNPNTYDIKCNNAIYKNVPALNGKKYNVGDVVQVLIKNGNWNKKFIDDKSNHDAVFQDEKGNVSQIFADDVLQFAMNCNVGVTPFYTGEQTTSLPTFGDYKYSTGIVQKRTKYQINIYLTNYITGDIATNIYLKQNDTSVGTWTGWQSINSIVEEGTSGIWTYRKWSSGIAECWGTIEQTVTFSKSWGNFYVSSPSSGSAIADYPFTFVQRPVEIVQGRCNANAVWIYTEASERGMNTTTCTGMYLAIRPVAGNTEEQTLYLDFYVKGKWR